jgi:hypothetical protein
MTIPAARIVTHLEHRTKVCPSCGGSGIDSTYSMAFEVHGSTACRCWQCRGGGTVIDVVVVHRPGVREVPT